MLGPIFNREALTVPRHPRHYWSRAIYLGGLWVLALTAWQALLGWSRYVSQGDLAAFGTLAFQLVSYSQLLLVIFFAAIVAAGAVAQEKDRRTFVLLLITDLRHGEIVLGKLLGSLLQILILLVASVPILSATLLLGGVSPTQVAQAFLILLGSALAAGAFGCLMALWREKTFQTLALTVLGLTLYFLAVEGLSLLASSAPGLRDEVRRVQTALNPFRALAEVILPPVDGSVWTAALSCFGALIGLASLLCGVGIWRLRAWNPRGEPIQKSDEEKEADLARERNIHAAPGKVRDVWPNPVLWREVATRAYGRRTLAIKLVFILVAVVLAFAAIRGLAEPERANRLAPALGLVPVLVLSLLLTNAQSVTSITTERDLGALELLLVTDLTPKEFLFGKLGGILWNTKEALIPPLVLLGVYAALGYIGAEAAFYLGVTMLTLMAFAVMLGVHVALRTVKARQAILASIGTIFFLTVGTMLCIYLIVIGGRFEYQWLSFLLFLLIGGGGLYLVLGGREPSTAIVIASWACPLGMFYGITSVLVGNPRTGQAGDTLWPFMVVVGAFGFTVAAMLVPQLAEFNPALPHQSAAEE